LFWGVTTNHAFRDGNKRTAVVLLRSFLNLNGHDHTLTEDALFELALGVAGSHVDLDTVESNLRAAVISL
jgi:death-on-curing protein